MSVVSRTRAGGRGRRSQCSEAQPEPTQHLLKDHSHYSKGEPPSMVTPASRPAEFLKFLPLPQDRSGQSTVRIGDKVPRIRSRKDPPRSTPTAGDLVSSRPAIHPTSTRLQGNDFRERCLDCEAQQSERTGSMLPLSPPRVGRQPATAAYRRARMTRTSQGRLARAIGVVAGAEVPQAV
jgi:hypothetical protein